MGTRSATPAKDVIPKKVEVKENGEDVEEKVVPDQQPSSKSRNEKLLDILVRFFKNETCQQFYLHYYTLKQFE